MSDSLLDNQNYELWVLLQQARDAIHQARDKELRRFGISNVQSAVLFIIQAIGHEATPTEISRWIFRRPHGVAALLARMERKGLVKRTKDLERKNMARIEITQKGYRAYNDSLKLESIQRIMSSLTEEERRRLKSWLLKLRDTACEELRVDVRPRYPLPHKTTELIGQPRLGAA